MWWPPSRSVLSYVKHGIATFGTAGRLRLQGILSHCRCNNVLTWDQRPRITIGRATQSFHTGQLGHRIRPLSSHNLRANKSLDNCGRRKRRRLDKSLKKIERKQAQRTSVWNSCGDAESNDWFDVKAPNSRQVNSTERGVLLLLLLPNGELWL